jgi:Uma2 family endonuclease
MGNLATPETLSLRWAEVMRDPTLQDLPYKIELNARGKIEMSPANNVHGRFQARLAIELGTQLPGGESITECSVLTEIGVRVPDVAWASAEFLLQHGKSTPFPSAPEICIEITSPSNSDDEMREKIQAYLNAGAREVWIVGDDGRIDYHDRGGKKPGSSFDVKVSLPDLSK